MDVDQVFVPMTIEYGNHPPESYKNLELLDESNRLIVVGDPGSGKSSLIKYLFRESCRAAEREPAKARLPIQIELRKIRVIEERDEQKAAQWLMGELRRQVAAVEGYDMGQLFDSCLTSNGLLLLLDGLDEVAGDDFPAMSAALQGMSKLLAAKSEHNAIVLTMRIQYHQQIQDELVGDYPQVAYLRPFKPNEIYTFLTRWPFKENAEKNITRVYADLTDRPTLRAMCSNPLVLAMYVANDQTLAPGEVPESRTEFYRSVVDELLVLRRRRQDIVRGPSRALREQREEILGELAYQNLINVAQPANSLAWADALHTAMRIWQVNETEAESRFRTLENETGIIAEERLSETFQFIHLTFCEFLSAVECASDQKRWKHLLETHRSFAVSSEISLASRLIEVIPFALALMPRMERPTALSEIAKLGDREVLGRCFLETQLYDREEWPNYVSAETKYLTMEGGSRRDEKWLRRLHLFSVVLRDARSWMDQVAGRLVGPELDGILPSIIGSNREALEEIFSLYASQDAPAAFRLAESVGVDMLKDYRGILVSSCQEPPFLALAMERAWLESVSRNTWLIILTEAALRYGNVAHRLEESQVSNSIPNAGTPVRKSAYVDQLKARSCYRECLEFALSRPATDLRSDFGAVAILSDLPTPTRFQWFISRRYASFVFMTVSLALLFAGIYLANFGVDNSNKSHISLPGEVVGATFAGVGAGFYLLGFIDLYYGSYHRMLSRALINVRKDPDKKDISQELAEATVPIRKIPSPKNVGRWAGSIFARSEQFALYKMAGLRGGIEISAVGQVRTDGDLLPPRKMQLWGDESRAVQGAPRDSRHDMLRRSKNSSQKLTDGL